MEMNEQEKVARVISLYSQGVPVEKIVAELGYSHHQSLSRFMKRMNYKWDNKEKNYVYIDEGGRVNNKVSDIEKSPRRAETNIDPLDLLENKEVLKMLQQSDVLLKLIEKQNAKQEQIQNQNGEKNTYNFWKKANEYSFMRKASYTTSVRLPIDLNDRFNKFKEETSLTQTQLLCMALDYFMNKFEAKILKN